VEDEDKPLTDRQRKYVQAVAAGRDSATAARMAGYSESFSIVAASRIGKIPAVKKALESIRAEIRSRTLYDLEAAVAETDRALAFAYSKGKPMSVAKLLEHKAKLHGLLIERHWIKEELINLRSALDEARTRVINSPLALEQRAQLTAIIDPFAEELIEDQKPTTPA
jgi:hypothetical protein